MATEQTVGNRLGRVLKTIRLLEGDKAVDAAAKLGVSASQLSGMEHGNKTVSMDTLGNYAKRYGYTMSGIFEAVEHLKSIDAANITEVREVPTTDDKKNNMLWMSLFTTYSH
jgi:transcriptional regulator with XRE-family HTH domain